MRLKDNKSLDLAIESSVKQGRLKILSENEFNVLLELSLKTSDPFVEREYGKQCYLRKMYKECAYWLKKSLFDGHGRIDIVCYDLIIQCCYKIGESSFEPIPLKNGFGSGIKDALPLGFTGMTRYLRDLKTKNGQIIYHNWDMQFYTLDKRDVYRMAVYVVTDYPEYKLEKRLIFFDPSAARKSIDIPLVEGFERVEY